MLKYEITIDNDNITIKDLMSCDETVPSGYRDIIMCIRETFEKSQKKWFNMPIDTPIEFYDQTTWREGYFAAYPADSQAPFGVWLDKDWRPCKHNNAARIYNASQCRLREE